VVKFGAKGKTKHPSRGQRVIPKSATFDDQIKYADISLSCLSIRRVLKRAKETYRPER